MFHLFQRKHKHKPVFVRRIGVGMYMEEFNAVITYFYDTFRCEECNAIIIKNVGE